MAPSGVLLLGGQGYIGSALATHLRAASFAVQTVDIGTRRTPMPAFNSARRYQDLTAGELSAYRAVVLLAGHSSVSACDQDPAGAFANNVAGFADLVHKLRGQVFIFASSISVYVNTRGRPATEADPLPEAACFYDLHKQAIERYAALAYPAGYALRLGTVCGPSPNFRTDLLLNRLVGSALCRGRVEVANPSHHRPLLGIGDLCLAAELLLRRPPEPGCYNLASANVTVGEAAGHVACALGVPSVPAEMNSPYDIAVSTDKFRAATGMAFKDSVEGLTASLREFLAGPRRPEA